MWQHINLNGYRVTFILNGDCVVVHWIHVGLDTRFKIKETQKGRLISFPVNQQTADGSYEALRSACRSGINIFI